MESGLWQATAMAPICTAPMLEDCSAATRATKPTPSLAVTVPALLCAQFCHHILGIAAAAPFVAATCVMAVLTALSAPSRSHSVVVIGYMRKHYHVVVPGMRL